MSVQEIRSLLVILSNKHLKSNRRQKLPLSAVMILVFLIFFSLVQFSLLGFPSVALKQKQTLSGLMGRLRPSFMLAASQA